MNRRIFLSKIFGSVILVPTIPVESIWNKLWKWVNTFRKHPKPKDIGFKIISVPLVRRIYPQLIAAIMVLSI